MSSTMNLVCTICSEEYRNEDEIISTYCGHVFHKSCYQDWRSRSTTCPECRLQNAQSHRIYLHIENPTERRIPPEKQIELENKISELENQLSESENNFLKFQETYCIKEEEIQDLKTEIECQKAQNSSLEEEFIKLTLQLQDSEKNFMELLDQINKSDVSLKDKEIEMDLLKLQNENREQKFQELKNQHEATKLELTSTEQNYLTLKDKLTVSEAEIIKLNSNMNQLQIRNHEGNSESCDEIQTSLAVEMSLKQKVKILEEKLRQTSLELEKEIEESTALTVENMKLRIILYSSNKDKKSLAMQRIPSQQQDDRKNAKDSYVKVGDKVLLNRTC